MVKVLIMAEKIVYLSSMSGRVRQNCLPLVIEAVLTCITLDNIIENKFNSHELYILQYSTCNSSCHFFTLQ